MKQQQQQKEIQNVRTFSSEPNSIRYRGKPQQITPTKCLPTTPILTTLGLGTITGGSVTSQRRVNPLHYFIPQLPIYVIANTHTWWMLAFLPGQESAERRAMRQWPVLVQVRWVLLQEPHQWGFIVLAAATQKSIYLSKQDNFPTLWFASRAVKQNGRDNAQRIFCRLLVSWNNWKLQNGENKKQKYKQQTPGKCTHHQKN